MYIVTTTVFCLPNIKNWAINDHSVKQQPISFTYDVKHYTLLGWSDSENHHTNTTQTDAVRNHVMRHGIIEKNNIHKQIIVMNNFKSEEKSQPITVSLASKPYNIWAATRSKICTFCFHAASKMHRSVGSFIEWIRKELLGTPYSVSCSLTECARYHWIIC